ncbi:precorrin-3B synthase [Pseudodonghicola xiamenensis]|uniref:Precorrin-3B synthase n=1 Tax=Pseudodonghicola xiamenensis TaxID=337702 RepID=A0A8J3H3I3_9RHOB|nr:precorrin-3B synthase [Pseudodonghicola xiamenensis]GHG79035.1 precorrin-3B synthase [Pseudodonghicola xiamenensis]
MSDPVIQGWCPGALRPMASGDGLVVRIRAPLGRLTPEQARGLAYLADRYGNGLIDLSARANLQLRGITPASHTALIDGLRTLGLVDGSIAVETRRNILLTPFWRSGDASHRIARTLTDAVMRDDAPDLPGKFGFAIDCGPAPVLADTPADIRLERGANGGLICRADGETHGARVTIATAASTALSLARWFLDSGGAPEGRGRMARHLGRGAVPPGRFGQAAMAQAAPAPGPGPCPGGVLVALEFGQMRSETLTHLADLGPLRLSPWRMLLIEGAGTAPALPGLITDPEDPRLRISACTGAPGCPQALAATRTLARVLAPYLTAAQSLHISGCAKGCAHPGPAPLTLVATGPDRFDLIRQGRASDPPNRRDLSPETLISHPEPLTDEGP